jgi:SNF2 family DNA or RNA helicase
MEKREMEIIENRALLLNVRNPDRITTVIPKSKVLSSDNGVSKVLVNWGLEESIVLKNLKIKDVPSPINATYKWPGLFKPFDHQKVTSSFFTMHRKAFCFNEQGTGKTASVIWAADYLLTKGIIRRVLVICPLSIMESAWRNDLFKFAMHRRVDIAYGKPEKRREIIAGDAEFVVINYDGLEIVQTAVAKGKFDLIVIDEANAYKNPSTRRWKVLNTLIKPDTWLWMLTGTPASQSPVDAYGIAKLVRPEGVPRFFGGFRDQVMHKLTQFKWVPKLDSEQIVHRALQPAIRFTKEQCLDLPEMTYVTRDVPLTAQQEKYYELLRRRLIVQAAGEEITTVNAAASLNKLLQLSGGAVYSDTGEVVQFDVSNRLAVLREVIAESSHKVLVFVPYRHSIELVADDLRKHGYPTAVIHGSVSAGKRTEIFERFQTKDDLQVLVIQPQAASHGVTLHAANTIVYWSPVMSVETYLQANARVHRAGQKNPSVVVHLQGSGVEKRMYAMLENKVDIHNKVIDLYGEVLREK